MKFNSAIVSIACAFVGTQQADAFAPSSFASRVYQKTALKAIGLGPSEEETALEQQETIVWAGNANVTMVEPDHELFRDTRLSDFDRECDAWYGKMLHPDQPSFLGKVSEEALRRINTLPKLERPVRIIIIEWHGIEWNGRHICECYLVAHIPSRLFTF